MNPNDVMVVVLKDILLCWLGFRFIYVVYISWYYIEGGGLPKKEGLGQFANLRAGWQGRGSGVLEGGWYPNAHYELSQNHLTHVLIQHSVFASNWCVRG